MMWCLALVSVVIGNWVDWLVEPLSVQQSWQSAAVSGCGHDRFAFAIFLKFVVALFLALSIINSSNSRFSACYEYWLSRLVCRADRCPTFTQSETPLSTFGLWHWCWASRKPILVPLTLLRSSWTLLLLLLLRIRVRAFCQDVVARSASLFDCLFDSLIVWLIDWLIDRHRIRSNHTSKLDPKHQQVDLWFRNIWIWKWIRISNSKFHK